MTLVCDGFETRADTEKDSKVLNQEICATASESSETQSLFLLAVEEHCVTEDGHAVAPNRK